MSKTTVFEPRGVRGSGERGGKSALLFAMALSFKEGPLFAGQVRPRVATTLALFSG